MISLKSIPFLRILLPYIMGIIFVLQWGIFSAMHVVFAGCFIALLISFLFQRLHGKVTGFKKITFLICTHGFLFMLAFETSYFYNAQNDPYHYTHYVSLNEQEFICTVNDLPVTTEKFVKLGVTVNAVKLNNKWHYTKGNSIIYVKQPIVKPIVIGEDIYIESRFGIINPPGNPNEFDYKTFLENRNVFRVVYADPKKLYSIHTTDNPFSLTQLGTEIKAQVVEVLRNSGLSQEAFSICSALLVGYDDEISGDVMSSFSHSGTLHVLSVSGMHTGLLYGLIVFIFQLIDKHDRYKKTKCVFVVALLFLFVLITGFSPSVLRAALMLTLVILGKTFYRNGNAYNTLVFSAFLLLLFNPLLIMDVGFLLSYLAVFGIMYLYPILNDLYDVKYKILRWFWSLSLMSVAATVFTLPVSLYYFHQFPVWFIFSNLIIIPLSIGLMAASFVLLLCYKVVIIKQGLAWLINMATSGMLWVAELTDNKTYGFIDHIVFTGTDVLFSGITIVLLFRIVATKSYKTVMLWFTCLIVWFSVSVFTNYKQLKEKELVVFSIKHKCAYLLRVGHTVYTHTDSLSEKEYNRYVKPYLLNYSGLTVMNDHSNLLKCNLKSVLNVQGSVNTSSIEPDYLIVSNNSPVSLTFGKQIKPLVIADCSNSYTFVKKLKKQCAEREIPFYSIKERGALKIDF